MPGPADFTRFVPGFDFLQGLVKTAGQSLPGMGQWIAPTLDPQELEKRIEQLRTVQFWLEQNARLLGATIQALEVQRMTLSTLKTMNVPMDGLREAFTLRPSASAPPAPAAAAAESTSAPGWAAPAPAHQPAHQPAREPAPEPEPTPAPPAARTRRKAPASAPAPSAAAAAGVDPMQWWGALTQQFTQLAAQALKDNAPEAARPLTDRMAEGMTRAGEAVAGQSAGARAPARPAPRAGTRSAKPPAAAPSTPRRGKR